jgi:hypothetical protein
MKRQIAVFMMICFTFLGLQRQPVRTLRRQKDGLGFLFPNT